MKINKQGFGRYSHKGENTMNAEVGEKLSAVDQVAGVIRAWQLKFKQSIPAILEAEEPQMAARIFIDRFQESRRPWEQDQKVSAGGTLDPYLSRLKSAAFAFLMLPPRQHAIIAEATSEGLSWRGESMEVFTRTLAQWRWMRANPDKVDELKGRIREKMRALYRQIPR